MMRSGRRALLIVVPYCALLALGGWFAFIKTPLVADLSQFVAGDDPQTRLLQQLGRSLGARLVFIGIAGGSERERAAASDALAARLRASGRFGRVSNGGGSLGPDDVAALFANRYLLSPLIDAERFTASSLRLMLERRLDELGRVAPLFPRALLAADPSAEMLSLQRLWQEGGHEPAKREGLWFSADGERALLLAETNTSGYDPAAQAAAVAAIEQAFADVAFTAARGLRLILGGQGVLVSRAESAIRTETQTLSLAGSLTIALLLALVYRSGRLVLLSILPLASAVVVGATVVALAFGSIYAIALGFAATLLGVVVDYPVHLFSHLTDGDSPQWTMRRIWPTLKLCVATTAIGYLVLTATSFTALRQFGLFSVAGLITAAAVTRWLLPALLPAQWRWRHGIAGSAWLGAPPRPALPLPRLLGAGVLLLLTAALFAAPPVWEDDLAALSPLPRPVLADDAMLRRDLGAPEAGHVVVVAAASAEQALQQSEAVASHLQILVQRGLLTGFFAPSRLLPSERTQRARQALLPERPTLAAALATASVGLPFRDGLFEPFLAAVEAARTAQPVGLATLAPTVIGPHLRLILFEADGRWLALLPLAGVGEPQRLAQALAPILADDVRYLSVRTETNRLMVALRGEALRLLAVGFALCLGVLGLATRSPARIAAVVLPTGLALAIDLAILTALGVRISLFHVVALLLVIGLGADYALFFGRVDADPAERARTLHALLVCAASTAGMFGLLATSSLQVLDAIGTTVAIGVAANLAMAVLLARPPQRRRAQPALGAGASRVPS